MTLHQLCLAYRNGDRWVCFTGSFWATGRCESAARYNAGVASDDPLEAGNCWELYREIAFRVTCEEPITGFQTQTFSERWDSNQVDDFQTATLEDLAVIASCVRRVAGM